MIIFGLFTHITVFAGEWRTAAGQKGTRWRYEKEGGAYAANGWVWLDGNRDGIWERYYFDDDGWLLTDTVTPDGYRVNRDGAWTVQVTFRLPAQ